jgi:hypothetical protein
MTALHGDRRGQNGDHFLPPPDNFPIIPTNPFLSILSCDPPGQKSHVHTLFVSLFLAMVSKYAAGASKEEQRKKEGALQQAER